MLGACHQSRALITTAVDVFAFRREKVPCFPPKPLLFSLLQLRSRKQFRELVPSNSSTTIQRSLARLDLYSELCLNSLFASLLSRLYTAFPYHSSLESNSSLSLDWLYSPLHLFLCLEQAEGCQQRTRFLPDKCPFNHAKLNKDMYLLQK